MHENFDIRTATLPGWEEYLCNAKNHEKVHLGEHEKPSRSLLERAIEAFVNSDAEIEERLEAVTYAVQATLNKWDAIVGAEGDDPLSLSTNPLICLPRMAYVEKVASEPLMNIIHRLWHKARNVGDYTTYGVRMILLGLGAQVPINNSLLVKIYREHFKHHSFIALMILLERGEVIRVSELFDEHASQYPDFDPSAFDWLVRRGLPVASAKKWLDQSKNATPSYEDHYNGALDRWQQIADNLALQNR